VRRLRSLLRRIGRLPGDKATEIARKLCAGLAAGHDKGMLHRDLKPANIMIDGRGQVLITDFGLAALAGQLDQAQIREVLPPTWRRSNWLERRFRYAAMFTHSGHLSNHATIAAAGFEKPASQNLPFARLHERFRGWFLR
jgi:serine/threonine protein kinase